MYQWWIKIYKNSHIAQTRPRSLDSLLADHGFTHKSGITMMRKFSFTFFKWFGMNWDNTTWLVLNVDIINCNVPTIICASDTLKDYLKMITAMVVEEIHGEKKLYSRNFIWELVTDLFETIQVFCCLRNIYNLVLPPLGGSSNTNGIDMSMNFALAYPRKQSESCHINVVQITCATPSALSNYKHRVKK